MVNRLCKPSSAIEDKVNPIETNKKYEDVTTIQKILNKSITLRFVFFIYLCFKFITKLNIDKYLKHSPMLRKIR